MRKIIARNTLDTKYLRFTVCDFHTNKYYNLEVKLIELTEVVCILNIELTLACCVGEINIKIFSQ